MAITSNDVNPKLSGNARRKALANIKWKMDDVNKMSEELMNVLNGLKADIEDVADIDSVEYDVKGLSRTANNFNLEMANAMDNIVHVMRGGM